MLSHLKLRCKRPRFRVGVFGASLLGCMLLEAGCITPPSVEPSSAKPATPVSAADLTESRAQGMKALFDHYQGQLMGFEYRRHGQVLGRAFGRWQLSADGSEYVLESRYEVQEGGEWVRGEQLLRVDKSGELTAFQERSDGATWQAEREGNLLRFRGEDGVLPPRLREVALQPSDAWMGFMAPFHEELMLATRVLAPGDVKWRVVSLSSGQVDDWGAQIKKIGDSLDLRTNLGERVRLKNGLLESIDIPLDEMHIERIAEPSWPSWPGWEIEAPKRLTYQLAEDAPFSRSPLRVPASVAGQPELACDLLLPKEGDRHPAVLMLGSSAPHDRYGFSGPPAVDLRYHDLSDALAASGYVVMICDSRGRNESQAGATSWLEELSDAKRKLAMLMVQDSVDDTQIFALGHAEGGWAALWLGGRDESSVAGVIAYAVAGHSYARELANEPELLASIRSGLDLPPAIAANAQWYSEILDVDPARYIDDLKCPVWIAQGGKDFEIDVASATARLGALLQARPKLDGKVASYPTLDHLFREELNMSSLSRYRVSVEMDRKFIADAIAWLNQHKNIAKKQ